MSHSFLDDPLWYKDAVIYELHVRSFYDANNDGFGEFEGLRRKLPYLESLGVNTLWLLPFLESPLKDDGYDTADYLKILPVHGSLDDFRAFLDEAHARGMRVITELVLNHTSDQHPWFQEARDPASPRHHWYVWSDTTERYRDARIIFTDTEISNWTWDRKAGKYYWHRFFSHQPDLNFDNPEVCDAMKEVTFFWLDLGVDGLRLDAVPYLFEREGTNCENLPETIGFIRDLRQAIEARYGPGKVLLAEANQWPEDTLPYFADGKGVQMAFNFPIMPRLYMALRRENRRPIVGMLELTEGIPDDCQWAIFLRNHDELTLEMVTDEERDYMYHEYATDPRFRINVGIRRRLAPLLGGDRRQIELLNALLLSLRGSPVIYYGDEIGMGDDPFLGDRNGVRTPMQWSPDKNGGFSRAHHHQLFMPAIGRGPYSYEFINVEDAEANPNSLLQFMRRMLALRRQHVDVFGRGSLRILPVENQSVLAFVREYEGRRVLVVANLSRFAQAAMLPPEAGLAGTVPVEMLSQRPFPPILDAPYPVLLGPNGFFWFALEPQTTGAAVDAVQTAGQSAGDLPVLTVREGLHNLVIRTMVQGSSMEQLERLLVDYLTHQRWFGAKDQTIRRVTIDDGVRIQARPAPIYLSILHVDLGDETSVYVLPLMLAYGDNADQVCRERPKAAIAWVETPEGRGLLHDATANPVFWQSLVRWWQSGTKARSLKGTYVGICDDVARHIPVSSARLLSGEQSNSSAILEGRFFAKLYRRLEHGTNPETELLEYLTQAGFSFIPKLHGTISFRHAGEHYTLGILQEALPVETDGWTYALDMIRRFLDRVPQMMPPDDPVPITYTEQPPVWLEELAPEMASLARILGVRTAEMHTTLSKAQTPGLRPDEADPMADTRRLTARVREEALLTRNMLADQNGRLGALPEAEAWDAALGRLEHLARVGAPRQRIRIHGDYHLGQVIRADGEFFILDFEGEPKRSLDERRRLDYAQRDVAGMLRSFEYAALAAWKEHPRTDPVLEQWTRRLVRWCEALFLAAYYGTAETCGFILPSQVRQPFLWLHLFEKALYEVRYELSHRPDWTWLPLLGLERLLDEASRPQSELPVPPDADGAPEARS